MDRRSFLTGWAKSGAVAAPANHSSSFHQRTLSTDLTPWVPDPIKSPWDAVRAGHLLRRTMMLPKWTEIDTILKLTPSDAVDLLLNTPSTPTVPPMADPADISEENFTTSLRTLDSPNASAMRARWASKAQGLESWYANVMLTSPLSIVEKMTFFWSGHFTSQYVVGDDYDQAPLLYIQNELYRNNCLGNFHDLVWNVTLDGAMLVYLSGILNVAGTANENYARELQELFTMGIGNYSEGDVKEAARILTGWKVGRFRNDPYNNGPFMPYFERLQHDVGHKTYLGVSFPTIVDADNSENYSRNTEIKNLIDTIFTVKGDVVAKFICRKIYKFFIYTNPSGTDENVISEMATIFKKDWDIKAVMSALLKSAHFFDNSNIGCQIKTPAEFIIGIGRQLGFTNSMAGNMTTILQELFNPPNVSGWTGWHDWITTNTYPVRSTVVTAAIGAMTDQNVIDFINQFTDPTDANKLITELGALMLPRKLAPSKLAPTRHDDLVSRLVGSGNQDYEWPNILSTSPSTAARNMRDVLTTICNLPDYQLC
ncbi:MAG: DUF1800 family protein [Candidatus Kapaibacterium sp.]